MGRTLGEECFFHVTSVIWWLLSPEPVDFCFCSETIREPSAGHLFSFPSFPGGSCAHPFPSWEPLLQLTSLLAVEQGTPRPLREHPSHYMHSAPQNSPVFLGADPCPPSQYFKIILHA